MHYFTSALDGGERSASFPYRFTPRERATGIHWLGGWVDPRAGLEAVMKGKVPRLYRDSNHRSSSPKPSAITLSLLNQIWYSKLNFSF
jgi:hypothetical protein